ncbi:hypothetical protein [Brasilonema sp. UFV-L1]|uniref:hypothetical protein n=1 Tax=Brasilonema sp. UFV-L1 TaxID=2234130 RepID=UPI00145E45BE|nr:hypothetical protein [Brasilonema sp. UFV-L1]NMG09974.1 hypothetical protein [Brasilonema sp. UFV-L1]
MLVKFLRPKLARVSVVGFLTLFLVLGGSWLASIKASSQEVAPNCEPVAAGKIYRFVIGEDTCITPLSDSFIQNLTDPFATSVLRQGIFPENVEDVNQAIGSTLGYSPTVFLEGEGSQIPATAVPREESRNIRYQFSYGPNENDAKIFVAPASGPAGRRPQFIEVMAFDERTKEYNYYINSGQVNVSSDAPFVWSWNGSTSYARKPKTMGQGCFACHHNGIPMMREIELPWNHWQSQRANISPINISEKIASESFFLQRRGAEIFESLTRGEIEKYYKYWLRERIRKQGSTISISDVDEMLRYLTTTTTVNFKSTDVQSKGSNTSPKNLDITGVPPNDTFLSDTLFQTTLGLNYSTLSVSLPRDDYDAYLNKYDFKLVGTKGFARETEKAFEYPGATYFAFYVPQVAAEDIYVTQRLLQSKVVTDKFVAALLMVDFKNPLFSEKRASLQKYAKQITTGTIANKVSSVPTDFAAKIKQTGAQACNAENFDACTAEEQFLYTWELPNEQWKQLTAKRLQGYVDSIANLETGERLDYLMRWSIKQRDRFASTRPFCALYEVRLMFPETSLSEVPECPALPTTSSEN